MNSKQFQDVQKFFETMPKLSHQIELFNPKTEVTSTITLEGLAAFSRSFPSARLSVELV